MTRKKAPVRPPRSPAEEVARKLSWAQENALTDLVRMDKEGRLPIPFPFYGAMANVGRALLRRGILRVSGYPDLDPKPVAWLTKFGREVHEAQVARAERLRAIALRKQNGKDG